MAPHIDPAELRNLGDVVVAWDPESSETAVFDLSRPDGRAVSYRELARMAGRVGEFLRAQHIPPGARIGILALNSAEYLAVYFGAMQAGYVLVPLNIKLPVTTLEFIIRDAGIGLVFVDRSQRDRVPNAVAVVDVCDGPNGGFDAAVSSALMLSAQPEPCDLAEMLYTSGSSGVPKGVALPHAGQIWGLAVLAAAVPPGPHRHIVSQPLFHMNGIVVSSLALLTGGTIVMQPRFEVKAYVAAIADFGVDTVSAVPTMWARALKEVESGYGDISAVESLSLGSAPVTAELLRRTRAILPDIAISISYGTTEAGPAVFGRHPLGLAAPDLALGYPVPGIEVRLVDGNGPDDGVLVMRTPAVMRGYHGLNERTGQVLADGWYYSGDVMRRDDNGFYYFVGRADDMFVCSGENIYPGEIEKVLEAHPSILQAAVVPLADAERGHIPVAFVVPAAGQTITARELQRFTLDHAAAYLHPRRVAVREELPWAGTNKIDRAALIEEADRLERLGSWAPQ